MTAGSRRRTLRSGVPRPAAPPTSCRRFDAAAHATQHSSPPGPPGQQAVAGPAFLVTWQHTPACSCCVERARTGLALCVLQASPMGPRAQQKAAKRLIPVPINDQRPPPPPPPKQVCGARAD
jgi:hypothetical protein